MSRSAPARAALFLLTACGAAGCSSDPVSISALLEDGTVFLVQSVRPTAVMEALYTGPIVRDGNGCLRTVGPGDAATVVWPFGARIAGDQVRTEDGRLIGEIDDIGGRFVMGGGFVSSLHAGIALSAEGRALADERCPGSYWIVGDVP